MGAAMSSIKALALRLVASLYVKLGRQEPTIPGSATNTLEAEMVYRILAASYTDAIYTLLFDPSKPTNKALSLASKLVVGHHPSWIERHPSDPSIIFAGLEQEDGRLLALKYNLDDGKGEIIANVSSGGSSPCSILVTGNNILVANYSSGTVGILTLPSSKDSLTTTSIEEFQPPLQFSGQGPCAERQESPHPHQVYLVKRDSPIPSSSGTSSSTTSGSFGSTTEDKEEVLVPDLGSDKIWRLGRNSEGKWEKKGEIDFEEHRGGGPRHVVLCDSKLYTLLELQKKITVHDFRETTPANKPPLLAEASLPVPEGLEPVHMLAAELLCPHPTSSFPTPYLYVSNRNDPRPHGDLISIFALHQDPDPNPNPDSDSDSEEDKKSRPWGLRGLQHIADVPTGLKHVRGFAFFGPDERYVVVGGANSGGVKVFERVDAGRGLKEVAHLPVHDADGDGDGGVGLAPTGFLPL